MFSELFKGFVNPYTNCNFFLFEKIPKQQGGHTDWSTHDGEVDIDVGKEEKQMQGRKEKSWGLILQ